MDDGYRLRIKLGDHEFEAHGSEKAVKEQFEQFKALIEKAPQVVDPSLNHHTPSDRLADQRLQALFDNDEKRKIVSLKRKPVGEQSARDAILLILLGFRLLRQETDVPVTSLKDAVEQTGFKVKRVDRFAYPCTKEQLVGVGGKGKGSKYSLSNTGLEEAQNVMATMLKRIA